MIISLFEETWFLQFYDNQNRQNKQIDSKNLAYDPNYGEMNKGTSKQISKTVENMKSADQSYIDWIENNVSILVEGLSAK